jgi:two-component system, cell cycle sensor histidine kinase and response regulator CckA
MEVVPCCPLEFRGEPWLATAPRLHLGCLVDREIILTCTELRLCGNKIAWLIVLHFDGFVVRYLFAVVCAVVALCLRLVLSSFLGSAVPFMTFFPAIMVSAGAGGFGAGVVTTILSGLAAQYFVIVPGNSGKSAGLSDTLGIGLFLGVGTIISLLNESLRKSRADSVRHRDRLRDEMLEQQRLFEALRRNRERLQIALDAANEGLWDLDLITGEAYYSPQYYRMLGFEPNEWPASYQMWFSLLHPDDQPKVDAQRSEQINRQNGRFDLEYRLRKKNGEYIWVRSRGNVVALAPDQRPARLVGTLLDVTEAKKVEEQLRQSQRLDSIGRLAGGVAHDFNNLLTVINGYAEMALDDLSHDDPRRGSLQEIRSAGDRAAQLTQQLLAFSRKQMLRPVVLNINQVVDDISKMLQRLIGENISMVLKAAPDLYNITADAGQLQQVIVNLAVNSRDAMPNGGTLIVETSNVLWDQAYANLHPQVQPGAYVMLAITDNGTGMTPEVQERLFEPFFTTKPKGQGTGLGLSTVYGIVRQSGGQIWAYSELGYGTTFKIYFPCVDAAIDQPSAVQKTARHGSERILVVEDQEEVRILAVRALERFGYTVHSASNGEEALTFCRNQDRPVDLVVTDVIMPGMNGRELAERLKHLYPSLRVVFMSGYTDNVIAHHHVLEVNSEYIQKPFSANGLAEKVRKVLGQPSSQNGSSF